VRAPEGCGPTLKRINIKAVAKATAFLRLEKQGKAGRVLFSGASPGILYATRRGEEKNSGKKDFSLLYGIYELLKIFGGWFKGWRDGYEKCGDG